MTRTVLMQYSIVDLLHKMESGYICLPNFNRGFIWPKENIKSLLESIYLGYPIGIILAIEAKGTPFELMDSGEEPPSDYKLWVVDGSQRLSALYNTLKNEDDEKVFFNLLEKEFTYKPKPLDKKISIPMSALFNSKKFMEFQETLFTQADILALMHSLNELHRRFLDYQVPVQIISEIDSDEVIEMFTRLNVSGIPLKQADLQKARSYKKAKDER